MRILVNYVFSIYVASCIKFYKCYFLSLANLIAKNTLNHGIVEICCMEGHTELLEHFIKLAHEDVPVWTHMLKLVTSTSEEEAAAAGNCLAILTKPGRCQQVLLITTLPCFNGSVQNALTMDLWLQLR